MFYSQMLVCALSLAVPCATAGTSRGRGHDRSDPAERAPVDAAKAGSTVLKPLIIFQAIQAALWLPWPEKNAMRDQMAKRAQSIMQLGTFNSIKWEGYFRCDWHQVFDELSAEPPLEPDEQLIPRSRQAYKRMIRTSSASSRQRLVDVMDRACKKKPDNLRELVEAAAEELQLEGST